MSLQLFHLLSLAVGILAYAGLTVFCIVTWIRRITGRAAFSAALATLLFLAVQALTGIGPVSLTLQVAALLTWMVLLARVIGIGPGNAREAQLRPVTGVLLAAILVGLAVAAYSWTMAVAGGALPVSGLFAGQVLFAIAGLVLLEQVVRNTRDDLHWRLRYLNIGVGTLFVFELVHGATALLFNGYLPALVAVQGAVYALAVPFVAVASLRNAANPLRLNLSRQFVFRSGMLVATGVLLLTLGALGYLVRLLGGDWGAAVLALFAAVAGVTIATLYGASTVRLRARRLIEEHLFPRKHDYRDAWQRVTRQLTEPSPDFDLPQQVIRALSNVLHATGGGVWRLSPQGILIPIGQLHTGWNAPLSPATSQRLRQYFESHDWVLDLAHLEAPEEDAIAELPDIADLAEARFLVPLMAEARLFGVAVLNRPPLTERLTWEDYDVLKLIARQASGFVALREAERELAEADKLNSFSQVSAFVIHDVKTISAQLSLLLENAGKHKGNPAFIDDMIATTDNAVARMNRLLEQLRGDAAAPDDAVDVAAMLEQTLGSFNHQMPVPTFTVTCPPLTVSADSGKLRSAVSHLIQNAIDAAGTTRQGPLCAPRVEVELERRPPWAEIHITDNGPGMDQTFIDQSLFQPFTSTKGVAGMGVGAYQARSYIRSLGGDISVRSRPGHGTTFTIRLPMRSNHDGS